MVCAVAIGLVLLSLLRGGERLAEPRLPPLAGTPRTAAPALELPRVAGGTASLAEARGQVVLVNFWATWCPPCRRELPALQALHAALASEGLRVFAVSVDGGPADALARFATERELDFDLLHDADRSAARRFGISAYPTSVVVDRGGRVVYRAAGALAWDAPESVAWFLALLREDAVHAGSRSTSTARPASGTRTASP